MEAMPAPPAWPSCSLLGGALAALFLLASGLWLGRRASLRLVLSGLVLLCNRLLLGLGFGLGSGLTARGSLRLRLFGRRLGSTRDSRCSARDERQRDVTGPLPDAGGAASRSRAPALEHRALVHEGGLHDEVVTDQVVVRLGVRDGRAKQLL